MTKVTENLIGSVINKCSNMQGAKPKPVYSRVSSELKHPINRRIRQVKSPLVWTLIEHFREELKNKS